MEQKDHITLLETISFAIEKHKDQRRKNITNAPYVTHPLSVATALLSCGITDLAVLQGAILHDTIEDTPTTFDELETKFGTRVANIVREVTDDRTLTKRQRKEAQIEHVKYMSYEARLVKLADKLDNLKDLQQYPPLHWTPLQIQGYFVWCKKVVDALRGTSDLLEMRIDIILNEYFATLGNNVDLDQILKVYYEIC